DQPLNQWTPLWDEYLTEKICLEGRGDVCITHCPTCPEGTPPEAPLYRCIDCMHPDLYCKECCVHAHINHPLDQIEVFFWRNFEWTSLQAMEMFSFVHQFLSFHHDIGESCDQLQAGHVNFTVIHTNKMQAMDVDFCGCKDAMIVGSHCQQVLQRGWYPAMHKEPQMCTTFHILEMFHIMTLQGNVTTYDFYSGLEKLNDNAGLLKIRDRYKAFMRMMREWQHLVMLMHAGHGNDAVRSVAEMCPGELGVVCPACPCPGINLPADWDSSSLEDRFLYILYLAIDTCFCLKRKLVLSKAKDPGLGTSMAYFTEDALFRIFLLTVTDQKEMSTCSSLAILDYANTKFSHDYGAMSLSSSMRPPTRRRGRGTRSAAFEIYVNMDYILGYLLRHHDPQLYKFLLYDICCQWSRHLVDRLKELPPGVRLTLVLSLVRFVIPKLHIFSHKLLCQLFFSLNYTPGSACTDGKRIEQPWASIGPVATST
ncbi:hypothetical protein B0H17DRAFT_941748, partial [Mycena rosella]